MNQIGKLSQGCELCAEGKKSVLFVTGKCPKNCLYCPLSEEKKGKDIIYINEVKQPSLKKIISEIKDSNSSGAGITGGDPLLVLERTIRIIKKLKKKFGKSFHIHLYTSLELIDSDKISKLQKSGLDELRVHPDIFDQKLWNRIKLGKNKFKEFGIEIPVIPNEEKRIYELINFAKDYVDFFNLNQLEYATLYEKEYSKKNWKVREDYSVLGSEKTAKKILKKYSRSNLRIHYCSANFKDVTQFTNRVRVRAKNIAEEFDKITDEGTLIRGFIPIEKNENLVKKCLRKNRINFKIEKKKSRIIFDADFAKFVSKILKNVFVIEEYPTSDGLIVETEKFS